MDIVTTAKRPVRGTRYSAHGVDGEATPYSVSTHFRHFVLASIAAEEVEAGIVGLLEATLHELFVEPRLDGEGLYRT